MHIGSLIISVMRLRVLQSRLSQSRFVRFRSESAVFPGRTLISFGFLDLLMAPAPFVYTWTLDFLTRVEQPHRGTVQGKLHNAQKIK